MGIGSGGGLGEHSALSSEEPAAAEALDERFAEYLRAHLGKRKPPAGLVAGRYGSNRDRLSCVFRLVRPQGRNQLLVGGRCASRHEQSAGNDRDQQRRTKHGLASPLEQLRHHPRKLIRQLAMDGFIRPYRKEPSLIDHAGVHHVRHKARGARL